jgi:predicted TIM-barrel fold metal-dependent hydrolase
VDVATKPLCVSGDSHVVEPPEVFAGLVERFGENAPHVRWHPDGGEVLVIDGKVPPAIAGIARRGIAGAPADYMNDPETVARIKRGYAGMRPGVMDPTERLKDQDLDGIDAEVVYPSLMFGIYTIEDKRIVEATFRNYNDWIANYCGQQPHRLFPLACIPLYDVDLAIEELERAAKLGHRGACIPCVPPDDKPYSDRYYDRFWAAAEAAKLPLTMHIFTTAAPNHGLPNWGPIMDYCMAPAGLQRVIGDIISGGVCARFPGLRFVPTEWETGWVAHFLRRLDWSVQRTPHLASPDLKADPSEYFHRSFYMTFEDDELGIRTRDVIGVRNLIWGSDYPHHDSIFPRSQQVLDQIFAGVPAEDRYRITAANVCELYGLPFEY